MGRERWRSGTQRAWLVVACVLAACSPGGGDRALTEAADARANAGTPDGRPPKPPYEVTLIEPIRHCSASASLEAMKATNAKARAAGALCAATLSCRDAAVVAQLQTLLADNTAVVEYVNRGTILGGGDQRVSVPVSYYARYAFDHPAPGMAMAC